LYILRYFFSYQIFFLYLSKVNNIIFSSLSLLCSLFHCFFMSFIFLFYIIFHFAGRCAGCCCWFFIFIEFSNNTKCIIKVREMNQEWNLIAKVCWIYRERWMVGCVLDAGDGWFEELENWNFHFDTVYSGMENGNNKWCCVHIVLVFVEC
jgi:hypothetical protein